MCFISLFKLLCDEPVSTVHAEQHQSTKIIIGKIAASRLSFLAVVLLQTLERQGHGKYCSCCSIAAIGRGALSSWEIRATAGLEMLGFGLQ